MSIATELQDLNDNILDAYTAIGNKGGTVPAQKNTANLDTAIGSIPAAPEAYIPLEVENGTLRKSGETSTWSAPNTATSIAEYGLAYAFYDCTNLTSVDLSSITSIGDYGMQSAFWYCSDLFSVDLRSVSSIGPRGLQTAFTSCISLTSLSFPALTTSSFGRYSNQFNNMLQGCSGVTVHFPAAIQSTIGNWGSVTSGFGGTNTTVLFDL